MFSDIDECALTSVHNCHAKATCLNVEGDFTCTCMSGYTGDGLNCTGKNLTMLKGHCT